MGRSLVFCARKKSTLQKTGKEDVNWYPLHLSTKLLVDFLPLRHDHDGTPPALLSLQVQQLHHSIPKQLI